MWFDLAREFTERWVHYQQIREAARSAGGDHEQDGYPSCQAKSRSIRSSSRTPPMK